MTKANQLIDELSEQQRLLDIRNSEAIENIQRLINMIRKYLNFLIPFDI